MLQGSDRVLALELDPQLVDRLHRVRADRNGDLLQQLAERRDRVVVAVTIRGEGSQVNTTRRDMGRLLHSSKPRTVFLPFFGLNLAAGSDTTSSDL